MADAAREALGRKRCADDGAAIIEHLDEIVLLDAAFGGVLRVQAQHPMIVAIHVDAVVGDVEEEQVLAVALGVERVLRMRREELQRIACKQVRRMRPLP